jgi:GT2 family glycosyltransferase
MRPRPSNPLLTVCVLTYGDHCALARRCLESIRTHTDRVCYRLVVGANAIGQETDDYLRALERSGAIDRVHRSRRNLNKCPMMRRMLRDVNTPYLCWFDDDSHVTETGALERQMSLAQRSPSSTVMWGRQAMCDHPGTFIDIDDVDRFVRTALWYRGLTPPGWEPGGKGEFNFAGGGRGDPRWDFILGGFWLIRSRAVRALDWPDRRLKKLGDDVLLGEALRQRGWAIQHTGAVGIAINQAPRRGEVGGLRAGNGVGAQSPGPSSVATLPG